MKVAIVIGTTRKGRVTPRMAQWIMNHATTNYPEINFTLLDLADYDLPLLEEAPWTPDRALTEGAQRWLQELEEADGYIFVTAEYNHGIPAVLKNALDYTNGQMKRKPALIYSHGVNQGARANELLRIVFNSTLGVVTVPVSGTFFGSVGEILDEAGNATGDNAANEEKMAAGVEEFVWHLNALTAAKA